LITHLADTLSGAAAMAAVALFFLKFGRRTRDMFFLLFAAAFTIDAISRFALGISRVSDTAEPIYFLPRLVMFGLIAIAIIGKNTPRNRRVRIIESFGSRRSGRGAGCNIHTRSSRVADGS